MTCLTNITINSKFAYILVETEQKYNKDQTEETEEESKKMVKIDIFKRKDDQNNILTECEFKRRLRRTTSSEYNLAVFRTIANSRNKLQVMACLSNLKTNNLIFWKINPVSIAAEACNKISLEAIFKYCSQKKLSVE